MKTFTIAAQKGGVGKTTLTVNLAHALSLRGKRVLVFDLDPQGQVSTFLGGIQQSGIYELVVEKTPLDQVAAELRPNLWVVPGDKSTTEAQFISQFHMVNRNNPRPDLFSRLLGRSLSLGNEPVDYVLFDTAPSVGVFQKAAIYASDYLVIPCAVTTAAMEGVSELILTAQELSDMGWSGKIGSVIPTFYNEVTKEAQINLERIREAFNGIVAEPVHRDTKVEESQSMGNTIFEYCPDGRAAREHAALMWYLSGLK